MIERYGPAWLHKITTSYDHDTLAYDAIQYNHDALRLGAVLKFQKKVNFSHLGLVLAAFQPRYYWVVSDEHW
jgi:hypothetical protein